MSSLRHNESRQPVRIYWAEDDKDDQFLIREAVRDMEPAPAITFFDNGHELLENLAHARPDRAVLDIHMPRLNGIETLKAIRKRPALRSMPVVMFSTAMIDEEFATCKRLEIQAFVQKPANFDEFAEAVAGIVRGTAEHRTATLGRRTPLRA